MSWFVDTTTLGEESGHGAERAGVQPKNAVGHGALPTERELGLEALGVRTAAGGGLRGHHREITAGAYRNAKGREHQAKIEREAEVAARAETRADHRAEEHPRSHERRGCSDGRRRWW